ncbi:MAG: FxsA family protein [Pseudomonadota bacterium]
MLPLPFVFLLFLAVPLVEIWLLIKVGGVIGALPTVALVVLTAVIGAALARAQGLATLQRLQAALGRGETPAIELLEGVLLLVGALLLLTPGFFTDALGFACLVPAVRRGLALWLLRRITVVTPAGPNPARDGSHQPTTIEGEFRREENEDRGR